MTSQLFAPNRVGPFIIATRGSVSLVVNTDELDFIPMVVGTAYAVIAAMVVVIVTGVDTRAVAVVLLAAV